MVTVVKSATEIDAMRVSGKMLATVLDLLRRQAAVGSTTKELADIAAKELQALGGEPAFLGYQGFPDVLCTSINDAVVHGIPSHQQILQEGDVVGLDFGVIVNGMITDGAITVIIGKERERKHRELVDATQRSLMKGIEMVRDGAMTGDIGYAIERHLTSAQLGVVRDLVGHGVGHHLHEEPDIPNYGRRGKGFRLSSGMTIAIEPMATLGDYAVYIDKDRWTVRTRDGSIAAHFEHTVLVTGGGAEILTTV